MDEAEIARILKSWAHVDDAEREDLLQQCLAVLDQSDCAEIDDSDFEMLAAAGDVFTIGNMQNRP